MIKEQTVEQYLTELASSRSTPGGGSAAALIGAMGAALVSMVCNLTVGKEKYKEVEADLQAVLIQAETMRVKLTDLADQDIAAFDGVMAAYGLPRQSDAQKQTRTQAVQVALKRAADVSLEIVSACRQVIGLSSPVAEKGNLNVVSDAGVAVVSAEAGLKAATLNVIINLNFIKDEAYVTAKQAELDELLAEQAATADKIYELVKSKI
jgi:formiminotetrahydrofolate cyclodeaminase